MILRSRFNIQLRDNSLVRTAKDNYLEYSPYWVRGNYEFKAVLKCFLNWSMEKENDFFQFSLELRFLLCHCIEKPCLALLQEPSFLVPVFKSKSLDFSSTDF